VKHARATGMDRARGDVRRLPRGAPQSGYRQPPPVRRSTNCVSRGKSAMLPAAVDDAPSSRPVGDALRRGFWTSSPKGSCHTPRRRASGFDRRKASAVASPAMADSLSERRCTRPSAPRGSFAHFIAIASWSGCVKLVEARDSPAHRSRPWKSDADTRLDGTSLRTATPQILHQSEPSCQSAPSRRRQVCDHAGAR